MTPNLALDTTELLRSAGLRSTAPRRAVLEALHAGGHYDAASVYERVKERLPGTSLQAVYVVLAALTDARLVRKITPEGGSAHYEVHQGNNHHHLLCTECGRLEDITCAIGEAPCLTPSEDHGFHITTAEVTFTGLCPDCRSRTNTRKGIHG